MSRRPYVRPISKTTWYMRNGRYKVYVLRELTSFLVAFYTFFTICALAILALGSPEKWDSFLASQQCTAWVVFHAIALLYFLFFQTFPWFKLAPKAMPIQLGEKKLADGYIIGGHYVAWIVVSAFILWLAGAFS
jgi:fumarate reductase subunit C